MADTVKKQTSIIDRTYYNREYYVKHVDRFDRKDRFTMVKVSRVRSLLLPRKNELIMDLGSGVGTMMSLLAPSGAHMIGMDYSSDSLMLARVCFEKEAPGLVFRGICCDGRDIAVRDGSIDGIMAVDFTEHLNDAMLRPTVHEVFRILKKGGRFVIYTPCKTHLFERLKRHNIVLKEDKSHIGLRTMKEYIDIMENVGFNVTKSFFEATHIPVFNMAERIVMNLPLIGSLARRRICICAIK
jgi:SAM-dependent methyltransferase